MKRQLMKPQFVIYLALKVVRRWLENLYSRLVFFIKLMIYKINTKSVYTFLNMRYPNAYFNKIWKASTKIIETLAFK